MAQEQKQLIGKDMTITEILTAFPEKSLDISELMKGFGINCVGCGAASFETLEQGVLGHGFSEADLNKILTDLNKLITESPIEAKKTDTAFILTSSAVTKVKQLIEQQKAQGEDNKILRISVLSGGCSGHTYNLELLKETPNSDIKKSQDNIKISVDQNSAEYLDGVELDYVDTLNEAGFKFNNPNTSKECGCGKSFS